MEFLFFSFHMVRRFGMSVLSRLCKLTCTYWDLGWEGYVHTTCMGWMGWVRYRRYVGVWNYIFIIIGSVIVYGVNVIIDTYTA